MPKYNIDPGQNYKRISNGDTFTGQQVLNLLEIAERVSSEMVAIILLDCMPTADPAMDTKSRYGIEAK